jgi:short-subunit dehydrogenase
MAKSSKPVVVLTGASSGIGLATAKLFAANGWIVVGTVRGKARASALRGLQFDLQVAEMLRPRDLERVVQMAWRTYGRIDALVCNAGYGLIGPLDTLEYAQMSEQLAVNTLAPAELIRQVVPLMRRQGGGVIIGMSSLVGRQGVGGWSVYAASKFALEGLFESLHMELAASRIRMKLVEPSGVDTPFWKNQGEPSGMNRSLSAEKVAAAILRAAKDSGSQLRYPLGQTRIMGYARRILPERLYLRILRRIITGN